MSSLEDYYSVLYDAFDAEATTIFKTSAYDYSTAKDKMLEVVKENVLTTYTFSDTRIANSIEKTTSYEDLQGVLSNSDIYLSGVYYSDEILKVC